MNCLDSHVYNAIIAVGVAAHSATLFVDYWLGKAEHIESNSLVELFLKALKSRFMKAKEEKKEGEK